MLVLNLIIIYLLYYLFKNYRQSNGLSNKTIDRKMSTLIQVEKSSVKKIELRDKTEDKLESLHSWIESLRVFTIDRKRKDDLDYLSLRLNIEKDGVILSGQDLHTVRSLYIIAAVVITVILSLFNFKLLPLVLLSPLAGIRKESKWRKEIKRKDAEIEKDFYGLYSEFFYVYRYPDDLKERLDNVAMRYYNRANDEMKHLINLLRADCKVNEEYALDRLKINFKMVKINRMADQVKLVVQGRNVGKDGLVAFKEELDSERKFQRELANRERKEKAEKVKVIPVIILLFIGLAWVVVTIKSRMV